jgi:hypothetical protein
MGIWRDGLNCYNLVSATVLATRMGVGLPGCCPGRLGFEGGHVHACGKNP